MSTPPDQSTPHTEWDHAEDARFRSTAATTGLVALITLRELARRRCALALALFTQVSSRSVDRRLAVSGAPPATLLLGRYLAVLGLGWIIGLLYSGLVLITIGDELTHPSAVPVMLLLTATVATPLGSLAAALVPRDLEGALLLLSVMAVQVLVDPSEGWTRVLPLWSTRELASVVVENLGSETADYLRRGLAHGAAMAVLLTTASWAVGVLRLRTVRLPAPSPAGPAYS